MHVPYTGNRRLEIGLYAGALEAFGHGAGPYIGTGGVPDAGFQTLELGGVATLSGHLFRLLANEEDAFAYQLVQFPQHFGAHHLRVLSQGNYLIIMYGGNVEQGVRAAEIVGIAFRNLRQPFPAFSYHVGVLSVVPQDVGHGVALLKHIAAAGQVVRPVFGVFRPGLVAAEPLAED